MLKLNSFKDPDTGVFVCNNIFIFNNKSYPTNSFFISKVCATYNPLESWKDSAGVTIPSYLKVFEPSSFLNSHCRNFSLLAGTACVETNVKYFDLLVFGLGFNGNTFGVSSHRRVFFPWHAICSHFRSENPTPADNELRLLSKSGKPPETLVQIFLVELRALLFLLQALMYCLL